MSAQLPLSTEIISLPADRFPCALATDETLDLMAIAGDGGWLTLYDFSGRVVRAELRLGPYATHELAVLPRLHLCAAVCGAASTVQLIDLARGELGAVVPLDEAPAFLWADEPTTTFFVACRTKEISVVHAIDAVSGMVRQSAPVGRAPISMASDPELDVLFVANGWAPSVSRINMRTGTLIGETSLPSYPMEVIADDLTRQAFVIGGSAGLIVLESSTGQIRQIVDAQTAFGSEDTYNFFPRRGMGLDAQANRLLVAFARTQDEIPPCAITLLDTRTLEVVHMRDLPGTAMGVWVHAGKHHAYILHQRRRREEGRSRRELTLDVLDSRTGDLLHREVVARHPLSVVLAESRNQLFIADYDLKSVVCVEDRLP